MTNENKEPFEKRHPVINFILSCIVLIVLIIICAFVLKCLFSGIKIAFNWLFNISAKIDAIVVVALITGVITILSSVITKIIDFKRSKKEYLAKKREKPYGEFVEMVYKIQGNTKVADSYTNEEMIKDVSRFSKEITLWGSPKVAKKWKEFRYNGSNPENAIKNMFVLEEIMNQMRKDLGMKKLEKGSLLSFFVNDIDQVINKK